MKNFLFKNQISISIKDFSHDKHRGFELKDIIYHFAEIGIIPPKVLRNYMMINDFDKFLVENKGHVGNTFIDLSVKYNISEKQAKNIVYKQRDKFKDKSNIKI